MLDIIKEPAAGIAKKGVRYWSFPEFVPGKLEVDKNTGQDKNRAVKYKEIEWRITQIKIPYLIFIPEYYK